jgi:outer membrane receptor protein involved in Fe transport
MYPRKILIVFTTCFAAAVSVGAQTAVTPTSQDPIMLSPFDVNAARDTGFVAASSLAGGRLAGDLKDTPVAYSVITRDFIDALGITNAFDASDWAPNSVKTVSSTGGGYGEDVGNTPGAYNVRGAGGGRGQRNFFVYNAPNDAYSVERFDFGRGPNAVLFGNGSLGGVATTMSKQARFDSNFSEISQTFGSWSNSRTTFDENRTVGDRLAFRAAGVNASTNGWRDKQFDDLRSFFLTTSFKLTRDTTLRAEGEYGESRRNQTFTNLTDQLSGWDGKTTYSGPLNTLPSNNNALGITRRGVGYNVFNPFSGVNAVMNYQNDPITQAGGANNAVPLAGFLQGALPSFGSSSSNILYSYDLPGDRFANAIAGSAFRLPSKSFSLASDSPVISERFKDLELTADHRIGGLYLQAAVDINRTNQRINNIDVRGSNLMYIDINKLLPDGTTNSHFLQPYADGILRRGINFQKAQAFRFAVGYMKDTGKWGNYTANVMGGSSENALTNTTQSLSIAQNADHRRWGASGASLGDTDRIRVRRYWNESSRPYYDLTSIRWVDPINNVDKTVTPIWALEDDRSDSNQYTKVRYNYAIASVNAKYFKNRLILLAAARADDFYSYVRQQVLAGDYSPTTWDGKTVVYKPDAPADYATLQYTPKDANGVATGALKSADTRPRDSSGNRLAQYANDRFKDDYNGPAIRKKEITRSVGSVVHLTNWLNPFINYAETFNPPPSIQRIDSSFVAATVAKGVDVGLRGTFLDGRLNVSVLRYKNTEINNTFDPGVQGSINGLLSASPLGDPTGLSRNIRGLSNVPVVMRDMQDREAQGYEFEAVANLTRQWRLSFNVGLPKVYTLNAYQDTKKYLAENGATLRQIVLDAGGLINANNNASVDLSIPTNNRSPSVTSAVNNYNALMLTVANIVDGRRLAQDQPAINLYTDYTLGSTKLKGLRLGGGVQYRGKQIIGYRAADTIVNPANPATAIDDPSVGPYTPIYSPASYSNVVASLGYTLRLANNREVRFDLQVNNLLNAQGPIFATSTALRPKNGDLTSPARETVPNVYAYKSPASIKFTTTMKF